MNLKRLNITIVLILIPFVSIAAEKKCDNGVDPTEFFIRSELINEFISLPNDSVSNFTTIRLDYQVEKLVEFRLDIPLAYSHVPGTNNQVGLGDLRTRVGGLLFRVPLAAGAMGVDLLYNTATSSRLGFGNYRVGPAAVVSFYPTPWLTISPYIEYRISFEDDPGRANFNRMSLQQPFEFALPNNWWFILEPKTIINFENDSKATFYMEAEVGKMLTRNIGLRVRPIVRLAGPRITDYSVEAGFRYLWY